MARPRSRSRESRRPTTVVHQPSPAAAAPAPLATQSGSPRLPRLGLAPPALLWGFPSPQPVGQRPFSALDLDRELATPPPPPPGRPPRDPRGVSVVSETPPELQGGEARHAAPLFNAAAVPAGPRARINSGSWADVVQGESGCALEAHSTRAAPAGLEAADAGGWVTVASRRPRRAALPDAPLKPRH
nr:protein VASP homolog [Aegilops tauschii subsp. strangulata]